MVDQKKLVKAIMAIQQDPNLTDEEKALRRQQLLCGKWMDQGKNDKNISSETKRGGKEGRGVRKGAVDCENQRRTRSYMAGKGKEEKRESNQGKGFKIVEYAKPPEEEEEEDDDGLKCAICYDLCVRPVTAPCQHNFCLKCFTDMNLRSNKHVCPSCRHPFGRKFAENPRINTALTVAIRAVRAGKSKPGGGGQAMQVIRNDDRPDEAFTTERAQRTGRANAASGRIMVNIPNDHFGPIPPEADPRGIGVQVGHWWRDRLDCRQWGAHFPHVAGIAGQSGVGAQSVVLSGGYEDDLDEGEWFLYTGSGGRDLSGNKRTSKVQSFDQTFDSMNRALKLSCEQGLPVRVVRSHKEKRSSYAPSEDTPVRYDGIYRIAKCWRKKGNQGFLMCRYLFVRCDNAPAPWSSDEYGDKAWDLKSLPQRLPKKALSELKQAKGKIFDMTNKPYWDWDKKSGQWGWVKTPPESQKVKSSSGAVSARKRASEQERALREMTCALCKQVMVQPVTTPCDHSFCKPCLNAKFGHQAFEVDPQESAGRSLRIRTTIMECPARHCTHNIAQFLRTARVNRDMEAVIERLKRGVAAASEASSEDPESSSCSKRSSQTHRDVSTFEKSVKSPEDVVSAMPAAWQKSINAKKRKEDEELKELFITFDDFDGDLIQQLLEQEEDVRAVRNALYKLRNNVERSDKGKKKSARDTIPVQVEKSPVRRSKRIRLSQ